MSDYRNSSGRVKRTCTAAHPPPDPALAGAGTHGSGRRVAIVRTTVSTELPARPAEVVA
jgi:hypothetical protein